MNMENMSGIYTSVNKKGLSKEGFLATVNNKTTELRSFRAKVQQESSKPNFPSPELKKQAVEMLQEITPDFYETGEADKYELDVQSSKATLKSQMEELKRECLISKDDLVSVGSGETISMDHYTQKNVTEAEPIVEISKPTFEEIETQEAAILDVVHEYELEVENVLEVMRKRYDEATEPRLKGLLGKELFMVQQDVAARIEKDLSDINDSEYLQIAGAKADLATVKDKILKITDGISQEEMQKNAA